MYCITLHHIVLYCICTVVQTYPQGPTFWGCPGVSLRCQKQCSSSPGGCPSNHTNRSQIIVCTMLSQSGLNHRYCTERYTTNHLVQVQCSYSHHAIQVISIYVSAYFLLCFCWHNIDLLSLCLDALLISKTDAYRQVLASI